jgi:hypothetical protein
MTASLGLSSSSSSSSSGVLLITPVFPVLSSYLTCIAIDSIFSSSCLSIDTLNNGVVVFGFLLMTSSLSLFGMDLRLTPTWSSPAALYFECWLDTELANRQRKKCGC